MSGGPEMCRWCGGPITRDPRVGVWQLPATVPDRAGCPANTWGFCHQPVAEPAR